MTGLAKRIARASPAGMSKLRDMAIIAGQRANLVFILCVITVTACLILGGGTRDGFLSDVILQLLSIPLFLLSLFRITELPLGKQTNDTKFALYLCSVMVLLPLLQLIILPHWIWTVLPQRQKIAEEFDLVGIGSKWMPMSVSPYATWLSLLSLLPPVAVFLGTIQLRYDERRRLSLIVLAIGIFSVFLGLIQLAQGPASPLRFFEFTNTTEAVGFFANRNHFSALLYSLTLFASAWAINVALNFGSWERRAFQNSSVVLLTGCFAVLVVLIAAQTMARSRAGLVLTIVALAGGIALTLPSRHVKTDGVTPRKLLLSATALAVVFAVQFALYRILDRFDIDPIDDARIPFARNTLQAAKAYLPFGSGMGTFVSVYAMFENLQYTLPNIYANHAHNDILELALETGLFGVALFVAFAVWFALQATKVWRRAPDGAYELDYSLARAATIVIMLLVAHSFVDYPLRTDAMMAIFAFSCALLVEPLVGQEVQPKRVIGATRWKEPVSGGRKSVAAIAAAIIPGPAASEHKTLPQHLQGRWGEDVAWPAEWSKTKDKNSSAADNKLPSDAKVPGGDLWPDEN